LAIYRNARPDDLGALIDLADRVFRKPEQTSMGTAFSLLLSEENASRLLIAEEDGRPVSLMGLIRNDITVAGCTLQVVSMGAVCTDPLYRGRNFAGTLVEMAIRQCEQEGVHLLLVSGNRRLYRRNDCFEVGAVRTFTLNSSDLDSLFKEDKGGQVITVAYDETCDLPAMLKLMQAEAAYYNRTEQQFKQLITNAAILSNYCKRQEVVLARTEGTNVAYAVFGLADNNEDITAEIIEFAGEDRAVLMLIKDIFMLYGFKQLTISAGLERYSLAGTLASIGCMFKTNSIPGTVRMINFMTFWETMQPYIEHCIGQGSMELTCRLELNGYRISYGAETLLVDGVGATLLVFNGPSLESGDLKSVLGLLFPLPFVYTKNLSFV
jgi:predicted N-acetyltransferase YhbS